MTSVLKWTIAPHFENFLFVRLVNLRAQLESRREWLLSLAFSWLASLIPLILFFLLNHFLSYTGMWSWMWSGARAQEPHECFFWLADSGEAGLMFCFALGFLAALILGWEILGWIFVPIALFAGVLSVPGAWMILLAGRLALWVRFAGVVQDPLIRRDVLIRWIPSLLMVLLLFVYGPVLRDWLNDLVPGAFKPELTAIKALLGLAFWTALETVVCVLVFHFYYVKTQEDTSSLIWNFPLMRVLSPWDVRILRDLKDRARKRETELQNLLGQLDPEVEKRLPATVLNRAKSELQQIQQLRQKSKDLS